jgi:hypothetical protein
MGRLLGSARKSAAIAETTSTTSIARKIVPPIRMSEGGSLN